MNTPCKLIAILYLSAGMPLFAAEPSLLEREPEGWRNLLESLEGWERVAPGTKYPLVEKTPWSLDAASGVLRADADGIYELFLTKEVFGDGVLHVEWRYVGESAKPDSGILFRASLDGQQWYQAQLATPGLGSISAKGYKTEKVPMRRPDLMRPAGEWNMMEITLRGSEAVLWINGEQVATVPDCAVPEGKFGLQAEFVPIEFRNVKFRKTVP